jgi:hypothetical protein
MKGLWSEFNKMCLTQNHQTVQLESLILWWRCRPQEDDGGAAGKHDGSHGPAGDQDGSSAQLHQAPPSPVSRSRSSHRQQSSTSTTTAEERATIGLETCRDSCRRSPHRCQR